MAIVRRGEPNPIRQAGRERDPFETITELMRWDPFQQLGPRLWRGGELPVAYAPAFDVRETKDAFVFKADLPGFREEDLDVNSTGNRITVSGKREAEQTDDTDTYYCCERSYGAFTRSFTLPEGTDTDHVSAELKGGVLTINVPKSAKAQPKRISIGGGHKEVKGNGGKANA